jgi:hypothetical protein
MAQQAGTEQAVQTSDIEGHTGRNAGLPSCVDNTFMMTMMDVCVSV